MSCIEWWGPTNKDGYGKTRWGRKHVLAHRLVFFCAYGYWPSLVRHTCDNPSCVNPGHLLPGTPQSNMDDKYRRGREVQVRGEGHGSAKLTTEDVLCIRRRLAGGERGIDLAAEYGVSKSRISSIKSRSSWAHV